MVSEFSIFGSCTCRDIFNSTINKNYKDYFHINDSGIRMSFISIMQNPVNYSKDSLKIYPDIEMNNFFSLWIEQDLNKSFLKNLKRTKSEYLLIDTYYDVNFGVIDIGDENYITNNIKIDQTDFYKNLDFKRTLTIQSDTEDYLRLWEQNCESFFNFLEVNCKNLKIILNPTRHVSKLLKEDCSIITIDSYKEDCNKYNKYRDLLDSYIAKNFDVDVVYFNENTLSDENHLWGASSLHYEESYFREITQQLRDIIKRDNILENLTDSFLIQKLKKQSRDCLIFQIETKNSTKFWHKFYLNKYYKKIINMNKEINKDILKLYNNNIISYDDSNYLIKLNEKTVSNIKKTNLFY